MTVSKAYAELQLLHPELRLALVIYLFLPSCTKICWPSWLLVGVFETGHRCHCSARACINRITARQQSAGPAATNIWSPCTPKQEGKKSARWVSQCPAGVHTHTPGTPTALHKRQPDCHGAFSPPAPGMDGLIRFHLDSYPSWKCLNRKKEKNGVHSPAEIRRRNTHMDLKPEADSCSVSPHLLNTHTSVFTLIYGRRSPPWCLHHFLTSWEVELYLTFTQRARERDRGADDTSAGWQRKLGADWTSTALNSKTHLLGRFWLVDALKGNFVDIREAERSKAVAPEARITLPYRFVCSQ